MSDRWSYDELEAAVTQLRKSERGTRALENFSKFVSEGGTGLDASNKTALSRLVHAALNNPWDLPDNLMQ